ncbi:LPS translocon maturation chaperone LptM [Legionella yabuuchiae]|nr:lipoprotein [Legionella yabuuchiae]
MKILKHLLGLFKPLISLIILVCLITACGQKGALYLPEPPQTESKSL